MNRRPRLAFLFRYGPAVHAELFHALPELLQALAREADLHYFGMRAVDAPARSLPPSVTLHELPWTVDRRDPRDKWRKTMRWIAALPGLARRCRALDVDAIYVDETLPCAAPLLLRFFGPRVAITVADFFLQVYGEHHLVARLLRHPIEALDFAAWRRLPLIFTRTRACRDYLVRRGIAFERIHPVYDPCDFNVYRPMDREAARRRWGYGPEDIVLVHHGILHPNKANDWIIEALRPVWARHSRVRYLLIGDGPEMPRLQELVRRHRLEDHVRLTGWLPRPEDVCSALNAGDIGLVMRRGNLADHFHVTGALVHAMACGLPVLAARLAGISEIVHEDRNGWLFAPTDPDEFAHKLLLAIARDDHRRACGVRALEDARALFTVDRAVRETAAPLLELALRR